MNEETNVGMEMKVKTPQEMIEAVQSEEQSVESADVKDIAKVASDILNIEDLDMNKLMEASNVLNKYINDYVSNQRASQPLRLVRSEAGLMISTDESVEPVTSPFALLQPGDDVNHQLVTSVEKDDDGYKVHLNYFGVETVLTSEEEVFSIFLKEQRDAFIKVIRDFVANTKDFVPESLLTNPDVLMRAIELLCAKVDMNSIDGILVGNEGVDLAIASIIGMSLRKPVYVFSPEKHYEPDKQTNVVLFTESYVRTAMDDVLSHLTPETNFYVSYQLSLFEPSFINKYTEWKIYESESNMELDRSKDQVIVKDFESDSEEVK